ncbi:hypothetical protein CsSME_00046720 [Camellia sinensis var. sinensis]
MEEEEEARGTVMGYPIQYQPRPTLPTTKKIFYSLLMTLSVGFAVFIVLILPYLLTSAYKNPEFQPNHLFQKSANWEIIFDVKNPNSRISYSYAAIHVFIFSKDGEFLSGTTLPPFHQGKKSTTLLHASLAMPSSVVTRNMNSTEPASYTIRFESNFSAHLGDSALLMVFCDDVSIRLSLNTTARTETMKKCTERKIII